MLYHIAIKQLKAHYSLQVLRSLVSLVTLYLFLGEPHDGHDSDMVEACFCELDILPNGASTFKPIQDMTINL